MHCKSLLIKASAKCIQVNVMPSVSVMEGNSATLNIDFSTRGGRIMWMFGSKCSGIAYITHTSSYLDSERFGDRLKLVPGSGSLAIRNMTTLDFII